ncbi:hypothetical protein FCH79_03420 [Pseudomonas koreensis]|nr:hypothetical protein [Pseudomonas koreensis]
MARELAPARLRSSRNPVEPVCLPLAGSGGFATQREQAPSPQFIAVGPSGYCSGRIRKQVHRVKNMRQRFIVADLRFIK